MKPRRFFSSARLSLPLATAFAVLLAATSAQAATYYWDVDGSGTAGFGTVVGTWNTTNNFWNTDSTGANLGGLTNTTAAADDLIISQATVNTGAITVAGTQNASSITFAANVGPTTTISGGTSIVIGGTGASSGIFQQSTGANTISTGLTLNSAISAFNFSNSSTGLLTIGAVTGAATSGTQTITVGASSTGGITLGGIIGNGAGGGRVGLTINSSGAGITTLSGANTFTGQLTVARGTLSIASINNVNANGTLGNNNISLPVILGSSGGNTGTLQYTGLTGSSDKSFLLATGGTGAFDVTTALTLTGPIFGSGNLSKIGAGTLTLDPSGFNGSNQGVGTLSQFTGTTTISNGRIKLTSYNVGSAANTLGAMFGLQKSVYDTTGSTGAIGLDVTPTGTATISAPVLGGLAGSVNLATAITSYNTVTTLYLNPQSGVSASYGGQISNGSGAMTLTKMGPGTQTLTGTSNYTGATTVIAGTLALSGANGSIFNSASYTVRGGTLELDNSGGTWVDRLNSNALSLGSLNLKSFTGAGAQTETVGATSFAVGGKVTISNGTNVGDQTTLAMGAVTRTAGAAIDFVGVNGTLGGGANSPNVTSTAVIPTLSNGIVPWATVGGTNWAEYYDTGAGNPATRYSIRAATGITYVDPTSAASNNANNAQLNGVAGVSSLASAKAFNSFNAIASASGQSLNLARGANLNLTSGAILKSGTDAYTISSNGGILGAGAAGAGTELITHVNGGDLTISAPLNTAIVGIAKGGSGNLILSGTRAATFTGPIGIGGGTLEFQGSSTSSSGGFTGPGNLTINLNPGQVFTVTGPVNSNFSGSVLVKGGTLNAGAFSQGGISTAPYAVGTFYSTGGLNNIELNGGNIAWSYTFGRYLGTGPDQIQLTGGVSGFSVVSNQGGNFNLNGNSSQEIVWGAANEASNAKATGFFNPSTLVLNDIATAGAVLTFASPLDLNASTRTIAVNAPTYAAGNANSSGVIPSGGYAANISGVIRNSSTGAAAGLTKIGLGTLNLTATNTYDGATTVSAGVLNIQNATALGTIANGTSVASGASLQIQGNLAIGAEALTLNGTGYNINEGALRNISGTSTFAGLVTLGSATRINSDAGSLTLSNVGTITGAGFDLTVGGGAGNITINSGIGTTTGNLTKDGTGTLTLTGTNTYTGNTLVWSGTLQVTNQVSLYNNNSAATWSSTNINVKNGATMAFNVGGAGQFTAANINTILGLSNSTTNGFNTGSILGIDTSSAGITYSNVIANPNGGTNVLGLTKLGSNTLILDQDNTYTGRTVISGGVLQIGNGSTTGKLSTSSSILNNGTLTINRSDAVVQGADFSAAPITGTGAFIQAGSVGTTLSAANTFTGTTTVSAGVLTLTNARALQNSALVTTGAGTVALNGSPTITSLTLGGLSGATGDLATIFSSGFTGTVTNLTLNPQGAQSNTYGGAIANTTMSLTKTGTGTQILSGTNTYTGDTIVNAGTLTLGSGANGSLSSSSALKMGGGTFNYARTGTGQTLNGLTVNAGNSTINNTSGQTLTLAAITRTGSAYGTVNFGATTLGNISTTFTNVNSIIGPWATTGTTTTLRYAVGSAAGVPTNISALTGTPATAADLGNLVAGGNFEYSAATTTVGNLSANTLRYSGGNTTTAIGAASTLTLNGLMNAGTANTLLISGGPSTGGIIIGSTNELVITANAFNTTINSVIADGGSAGTLVYSGGGTLTLGGANLYSGGTVINSGTVALASAVTGAIGTGPITINNTGTLTLSASSLNRAVTLNGGTLNVNAGTETVSGTIALSANSTIQFAQSNFSTGVINSAISGAGGLTKTGAGVLRFTNASNTYTGPTVISAGGIAVTKSLYGNDTTQWTPANITVAANAVFGMHVGGSGEFTTAQVATMFTNLTTNVNNNGLLPGSIPTIYTTNAPAGTYTYSAVLADSTGPGGGAVHFKFFGSATTTLELTGANTYSGATLIENNGTLRVSSFNSVATNAALGTVHSASSSLGAPTTVANGTIWLGVGGWNGNNSLDTTYAGASLVYTGTGETTDRVLNIGGANSSTYTLDQSGTGLLKFVSNLAYTEQRGPKTITLQGSTTGTAEFGGMINNPLSTGVITNITKAGTGTWTLSGANTYTGATTINGGTLLINGSTSTSSAVSVNSGGTLGGNGTIGGNVTVQANGTFAPGNSIDSIASGNLALLASSTYAQEVNKFAALGVSGDITVVTGSLSITALANLTLTEIGTSGAWDAGDKITLIGYSTGIWNGGLFTYLGNTLADGSTINFSGTDWTFNYDDTAPGDNYQSDMAAFTGSARYVTMTAAIPEPSSLALLGLGSLLLLRRRR